MPKRAPRRFRVIGHRGSGRGPDENTLASCRRAIRDGADVIELDVQLIDGKLQVAHPPRKPKMTLGAALGGIDRPVVLHLKRRRLSRRHDRKALALLDAVTHRPGMTVSSCWPGTLRRSKRLHPGLRTAFITRWLGWDRRFADSLGIAELHAWHRTLTASAVRKAGRPVIAFVPNRPIGVKVDGVITDAVQSFVTHDARGTQSGR